MLGATVKQDTPFASNAVVMDVNEEKKDVFVLRNDKMDHESKAKDMTHVASITESNTPKDIQTKRPRLSTDGNKTSTKSQSNNAGGKKFRQTSMSSFLTFTKSPTIIQQASQVESNQHSTQMNGRKSPVQQKISTEVFDNMSKVSSQTLSNPSESLTVSSNDGVEYKQMNQRKSCHVGNERRSHEIEIKHKWTQLPRIDIIQQGSTMYEEKHFIPTTIELLADPVFALVQKDSDITARKRHLSLSEALELLSTLPIFSITKNPSNPAKKTLETLLDWEIALQPDNLRQSTWSVVFSVYSTLIHEIASRIGYVSKMYISDQPTMFDVLYDDAKMTIANSRSLFRACRNMDLNPMECLIFIENADSNDNIDNIENLDGTDGGIDMNDNEIEDKKDAKIDQQTTEKEDGGNVIVSIELLAQFVSKLLGVGNWSAAQSEFSVQADLDTLFSADRLSTHLVPKVLSERLDNVPIATHVQILSRLLNIALISDNSTGICQYFERINDKLRTLRSEKRECAHLRKSIERNLLTCDNMMHLKLERQAIKNDQKETKVDLELSNAERLSVVPICTENIGVDSLGRRWRWIYVDTKLDKDVISGSVEGLVVERIEMAGPDAEGKIHFHNYCHQYFYPQTYRQYSDLMRSLPNSSQDKKIRQTMCEIYLSRNMSSAAAAGHYAISSEEVRFANDILKPFGAWMEKRSSPFEDTTKHEIEVTCSSDTVSGDICSTSNVSDKLADKNDEVKEPVSDDLKSEFKMGSDDSDNMSKVSDTKGEDSNVDEATELSSTEANDLTSDEVNEQDMSVYIDDMTSSDEMSFVTAMVYRLRRSLIRTKEMISGISRQTIYVGTKFSTKRTDYKALPLLSMIDCKYQEFLHTNDIGPIGRKSEELIDDIVLSGLTTAIEAVEHACEIRNPNNVDEIESSFSKANSIIGNLVWGVLLLSSAAHFKRCKVGIHCKDVQPDATKTVECILNSTELAMLSKQLSPLFVTHSHTIRAIENINVSLSQLKRTLSGLHK